MDGAITRGTHLDLVRQRIEAIAAVGIADEIGKDGSSPARNTVGARRIADARTDLSWRGHRAFLECPAGLCGGGRRFRWSGRFRRHVRGRHEDYDECRDERETKKSPDPDHGTDLRLDTP
jgi:hypothetical protein